MEKRNIVEKRNVVKKKNIVEEMNILERKIVENCEKQETWNFAATSSPVDTSYKEKQEKKHLQ